MSGQDEDARRVIKGYGVPLLVAFVFLVALIVFGAVKSCTAVNHGGGNYRRFSELLHNGGTCAELFDARDRLKDGATVNWEAVETANEQLREVGCHSRDSERR